jgi:excisionase family DNA binding protein
VRSAASGEAVSAVGPEPLLSIADAARYLNVSTTTVRNLAVGGKVRSTRVGDRIRFRRTWLDEWIDAGGGEVPVPPPTPKPAHDLPLPPARVSVNGVRVLGGVPYADLPGVRPLELDLYLPPTADVDTPTPVVVFLHGGGWRLGSRRSLGPSYAGTIPHPFEQVAAAGIAVASADYRLSGEQTWPAPLHDAKAAVRWLRSRGLEAGLDPARIGAWGESAGGHLALLLGLTGVGSGVDLDGDVGVVGGSSAVRALAAWYAPSDLTALPHDLGADPAAGDTREAQLLGAPLSAVPDLVRQASPITYVTADASPILLLHGDSDRLIPGAQSVRLDAALRHVGVVVEFETYPGADHMWSGAPEVAAAALSRTVTFFGSRL